MGAIETLTKLMNLQSAAERQQGSQISPDEKFLIGQQNRLEDKRTADFKYIREQQQAQEKEEFDRLKYVTNTYSDLYFKANGNSALQGNILQTMQDMKSKLPQVFREQFDNFTKAGPFSKAKEDERRWTEINGTGPAPLTEEQSQDLNLVAAHSFASLDYNFSKKHFLTGQAPTNKPKVVSVSEGVVAYRGEDNIPYLMTTEEFGLKKTCDKLGINYGNVLANGGVHYGDQTFTSMSNGVKTTYKSSYDLLNRKPQTQEAEGEGKVESVENYQSGLKAMSSEKISDGAHFESKLLTEVLTTIATKGKSLGAANTKKTVGERIAKRALGMMKKRGGKSLEASQKILNEALSTVPEFRNIHFLVTDNDFDTESWYEGDFGLSENARIVPVYGEMTPFKSSDGHEVALIRDSTLNRVYNGEGQNIGDYDQAAQWASKYSYKELTGENPPTRSGTIVPEAATATVKTAKAVLQTQLGTVKPKKEDYYETAGEGKIFKTPEQTKRAKELARQDILKAYNVTHNLLEYPVSSRLWGTKAMWGVYGDLIKWAWGSWSNFVGELIAGQARATQRLGGRKE